MKILYLTSMYPLPWAPYGGIFITRRIQALKQLHADVIPVAVVRQEKKSMDFLRKIVGKKRKFVLEGNEISAHDGSFAYRVERCSVGVLGQTVDFLTGQKYSSKCMARRLARTYKSQEIDIVHAHWLYPMGWAAEQVAKELKIPVCITCHGSDVNVFMAKKRYRKVCLETLESADQVEFVSQALLNKAKSFGYSGRNAVIRPNGIESTDSEGKIACQHISPTVGFVGSLIPVKRADHFAEIFRYIQNNCRDRVHFLLVGAGFLRDEMEKDLKKYGLDYEFTGFVPPQDVAAQIDRMDVMILPSRNEGWPCVVLEAHSRGIPVVGSNQGGIAEAVGDKRLIVEDNEDFDRSFAQTVSDVLNKKITVDSMSLIERSHRFIWKALLTDTLSNYERLVSHNANK